MTLTASVSSKCIPSHSQETPEGTPPLRTDPREERETSVLPPARSNAAPGWVGSPHHCGTVGFYLPPLSAAWGSGAMITTPSPEKFSGHLAYHLPGRAQVHITNSDSPGIWSPRLEFPCFPEFGVKGLGAASSLGGQKPCSNTEFLIRRTSVRGDCSENKPQGRRFIKLWHSPCYSYSSIGDTCRHAQSLT